MTLIFLGVLITGCSACSRKEADVSYVEKGFPQPAANRMLGTAFLKSTMGMSEDQREAMIKNEIEAGNIPEFIKKLYSVRFRYKSNLGKNYDVVIWVMPDYLAVGSDQDFVRVPMNPLTAQAIASRYGFILPTRKLVDTIYQNAPVKLAPKPKPPGKEMTSSRYYLEHNQAIQSQLGYKLPTGLVAGHKKDVVITQRLQTSPGKVAIYGWHQKNGQAIQPLSLVHHNRYADYSHGIRLIRDRILVNGKDDLLSRILTNQELAPLFSDEGALRQVRYQLDVNVSQLTLISDFLSKFKLPL